MLNANSIKQKNKIYQLNKDKSYIKKIIKKIKDKNYSLLFILGVQFIFGTVIYHS